MFGPGFGFGINRGVTARAAASGGGGASPATSTFSMTQLPAMRGFQRSTLTGGSQNKGQGTVRVSINATQTGTVMARISSGSATRGDLQAQFALAEISSTGAQTIPIPNVDARLGWFYVDLLDSTGWKNGNVPVCMGRGIVLSGQSQAVRQIDVPDGYTGTNASLGIAISPNCSVFAGYGEPGHDYPSPAWAAPADGSNYDSTFLSETLRRQAARFGVNCFVTGYAVGSTQISQWQPGQTYYETLAGILDAVGGFEACFWHLGGNDAGADTSNANYQAGLTGLFNGLAAHNAARGASFEKYVCAMATRLASGAGTAAQVTTIRQASKSWAASNSATYLEPHDIVLEDAVHQGQVGNIRMAIHFDRATAGAHAGPALVSAVREPNSDEIKITTSIPSGASALALLGTPAERFLVANAGTTVALALSSTSPIAIADNIITLKLAAVPAGSQALDVYVHRHPDPSGTMAAANLVTDNFADASSVGRHLVPTLVPIVVPAPGGGTPTPTPTPGLIVTDTFTGADGTDIASHAADTGQSWAVTSGSAVLQSGRLMLTSGTTVLRNLGVITNAKAYVKGLLRKVGDQLQSIYLIGRYQDANNFYLAGYRDTFGWQIGKMIGGSYTALQTTTFTMANGVNYSVEFRLDGTNLSLLVDGTVVATATDNAITAAGLAGVRCSGSSASTPTTGYHWDNFEAGTL